MLSKDDETTLEEIIDLNGKCMDSARCSRCPFRSMCLPEFLNPVPPSPIQRSNMAIDILTHSALMDADVNIGSFKEMFRGITKER